MTSSSSKRFADTVGGLLSQPVDTDSSHSTRAGVPIYRRGAVGFEEWESRILGKAKAIENQGDPHDEEGTTIMNNKLIDLSAKVA